MTKGKKWTLRLLGVAALALLICLCLMGSTMARYTSTGTGNGSLTVALWDLEATPADVEGESVSPSELPYYTEPDGNTAQERSNTSAYIKSFTMKNNSEVDAEVSVTLDEEKGVEVGWQTNFTWQNGLASNQANDYGLDIISKMGLGTNNETEDTEAFEAIVNGFGVFSIALAFEIGVNDLSNYTGKYITQTNTTTGESVYLVPLEEGDTFTIEAGGEEDFYAEVIWTSIMEPEDNDENLTTLLGLVPDAYYETDYTKTSTSTDISHIDWESFSDDVDTILGMYAEKLTFNVVWKAVQASTLPTDTTVTEP